METRTATIAYRALCRVLEARTGLAAFAFYERRGAAFVLRHASDGYRALMPADGVPASFDGDLAGGVQRVAPELLGLAAAACLVHPVLDRDDAVSGFVVIASRRARRTAPRLADALRDAAIIAGQLGKPADPVIPHGPAALPEAPGAVPVAADRRPGMPDLSRQAVHQLIASLLRARRRSERLAFVVLDIDRFRAVNEALGAEAGDAALAATAARIEACLATSDRLIRLDRDRFLVVTSPERQDVRSLGEEMLAAIAAPISLAGRRLALQASVGVVLAGHADISPVRLLMQADAALRQAKADGGSRVQVHEPGLHAALLDRSLMELDLRHAVGNRELSLVYQPYLDLATGEPSGVEALLRWTHPTRGEIAPGIFIPLAEATGQILQIGMWVLRTACAEAAGWGGDFALSVNVSPMQFHAPGFVEEVDAVLAATGFPAERLELEITETVLMQDNPQTIAQLKALIARGLRIALDDFGTGYSALAYLSRLPHHRIKLDKSFVQDMARPSTAGLIRAIIALARASGIAVTAEGVEREDQLRAAKAIGFTHAQGFVTGLPVRGRAALVEATAVF